jgi:uncharacterized protein (DUF2062 family)
MRLRRSILRRLPDRDRLRRSYLYRLFGRHILSRDLWHLDARSLAGGFSLGLFIAFTPTIPFHMVLACLGALYFRVNLPAALLACWVSNPLTAIPIYATAWRIGETILHSMPLVERYLAAYAGGKHTRIVTFSFCLWTGSLLLAMPAALVGNLSVRWLWWRAVRLRQHRRRRNAGGD